MLGIMKSLTTIEFVLIGIIMAVMGAAAIAHDTGSIFSLHGWSVNWMAYIFMLVGSVLVMFALARSLYRLIKRSKHDA